MRKAAEWMERHQVVLYLLALAGGASIGLAAPGIATPARLTIEPVLALLLYVTFLGVPFSHIRTSFRDHRFLGAVFAVNFVVAPIVVWLLSRLVSHDDVLLIGVLFVLLTPCVDYVIVFTGIAGGARDRLLAAAPLLMIGQMALLPLYLWAFVGPEFISAIDPAPFVEALLFLIILPLAAATVTQAFARRSGLGRRVMDTALSAMVPLMMVTLAVVVTSQISRVGGRIDALMLTVPVFVLFAVIMLFVGRIAGRALRLDVPGTRAVMFSGATRNSLVVLPLVLALPATYGLAALVVVTQTLVELILMVVFVRLVPKIAAHSGHREPERPFPL
ncbi:arsenic resistance protein [Microbacterium amylolyticum]|uniref:ACR3 family arsenite efflux pump ArsB n=1 Tax=Microbacterium amylolyticum TaxID=936337 RepID=A0ABS4ZEH2_9MICO|nr:bile acid:sodium symporter [Microbacterium amylolyticum]MBP2435682.1 ACR3 family arsenite efflux pump ArsB [Microbacterium amylolyticum]